MVSNMNKQASLNRVGSVVRAVLNKYIKYPRDYNNYVASNDKHDKNTSPFKVGHIKRFNHYSIMPPYTQEDYRDFEKVWATTLAGAVLDKKTEFIVGGGIRPVFDLKKNIKRRLNKQEVRAILSSYDDLMQRLIDIDEQVEFNQRLKISILLSKVFGRVCMLFDYNDINSKIPSTLKIIHPRYLGRIKVDETTWKPAYVQVMLADNEYLPIDEMIYLVNLPYTPVLNSDWYGFSELQRVVGAAKALQRFIEYDAPEIAESMWAGYGLFIINTANKSKEEADVMLNALVNNLKPGAFNAIAAKKEDVDFKTLDLEPKVQELVQLIDAYERLIIGNSTVPSALLGREEDQNMATLKGKIEFFMNGVIRAEREAIVREVSRQWYQRLVERIEPSALNELNISAEFEPFIVSNWIDMVDAVKKLKELLPNLSEDAILTILGLEYLKNDTSINSK